MAYRAKTRRLVGAATTTLKPILSPDPRRVWAAIQCSRAGPNNLIVVLYDKADSSIYAQFELSPTDVIVFSRYGDMPWDGAIAISSDTGLSSYVGGEVYLEKT